MVLEKLHVRPKFWCNRVHYDPSRVVCYSCAPYRRSMVTNLLHFCYWWLYIRLRFYLIGWSYSLGNHLQYQSTNQGSHYHLTISFQCYLGSFRRYIVAAQVSFLVIRLLLRGLTLVHGLFLPILRQSDHWLSISGSYVEIQLRWTYLHHGVFTVQCMVGVVGDSSWRYLLFKTNFGRQSLWHFLVQHWLLESRLRILLVDEWQSCRLCWWPMGQMLLRKFTCWLLNEDRKSVV